MATCAHFGVATRRTENPGVWVDETQKICALGVHLRRNVSSHGIGLNVSTEMGWFERIVACGLEGKRTTSLSLEGVPGLSVEEVGDVFFTKMRESLEGIKNVRKLTENEVDSGTVT